VTPKPDAHSTISHAQEARKCLSEFHAFAASHDAVMIAQSTSDAPETLDMVNLLRRWLSRYADALR
jgi:hypothetical protein